MKSVSYENPEEKWYCVVLRLWQLLVNRAESAVYIVNLTMKYESHGGIVYNHLNYFWWIHYIKLQSNTPDELPERLIGAVRVSHIELSSAIVPKLEPDPSWLKAWVLADFIQKLILQIYVYLISNAGVSVLPQISNCELLFFIRGERKINGSTFYHCLKLTRLGVW